METVIKQAEENRQRSNSLANRFHEEYQPLKGEIDGMRREYLGLERLPDLHEEEGSAIPPERFQNTQSSNYYAGKLNATSGSFTRPTPVPAQNPHHPLPPNDPGPIAHLNASHGFLPPAPPSSGLRGLSSSKPNEMSTPTRIQQAPTSLGMHPTFRSDFNVSLRYFFVFLLLFFHILHTFHFMIIFTHLFVMASWRVF